MIWVKYKNSLSELRPFLESVSLAFTTSNTFYGNSALVPENHPLPQKNIWAKFTVQFKTAQTFFLYANFGGISNKHVPPYQHHNNKNRWMNSHQQLQVMEKKPYS